MTATFNTSLLREKFVIIDNDAPDAPPITATSNRLEVPYRSDESMPEEMLIVRAQNMHSCARYAARIAQDQAENGPIIDRKKPFDWRYAWLAITKGYEKTWNPQGWVAVYHKGRLVYQDGEGTRHPFLDIIEKCDAVNTDTYDQSIKIAEDAFNQAGKNATISYDSNVAMIMSITPEEGKCGVIVRGPIKATTFNFIARPRGGRKVKASQCLTAVAAFLEGIQLAFFVGLTNVKVESRQIESFSEPARQSRDAAQKIGRLNEAIAQFENLLEITYRPDRPEFSRMIDESEEFARKIIR